MTALTRGCANGFGNFSITIDFGVDNDVRKLDHQASSRWRGDDDGRGGSMKESVVVDDCVVSFLVSARGGTG
jgi:hypothetical protein